MCTHSLKESWHSSCFAVINYSVLYCEGFSEYVCVFSSADSDVGQKMWFLYTFYMHGNLLTSGVWVTLWPKPSVMNWCLTLASNCMHGQRFWYMWSLDFFSSHHKINVICDMIQRLHAIDCNLGCWTVWPGLLYIIS